MDVSEILSAFVDGERVEAADLAAALGQPGAREVLIDFVLLRAALADDSAPSDAFVQRMRRRLADRRPRAARLLRLAAALAIAGLATLGGLDLLRSLRPERRPDEPPTVARVIRFEPGVDWRPMGRR